MTVIKIAKKGYRILLDSGFVERSVCKSLKHIDGDLDYDNKCTLILGSTGAIGSQVINKIVESVIDPGHSADVKNCNTDLILVKRNDTFLSRSLYSLNEYNIIFEEVSRVELDLQLEHKVSVIHSRYTSKRENVSRVINIYEVMYPQSSNWFTILENWKDGLIDVNLPHYGNLTSIISCLGTTKSQLKRESSITKAKKMSQRDIDYTLNLSLIKAVANSSLKIILLTSFNSYTLGVSVPYFKNKLDLEKDVASKLEFEQLYIVRPGPYVLCGSNHDIVSKYVLSDALDYRSFMSQMIAYNFYKTQLSRFFGYCVNASDVVKTIEVAVYSSGKSIFSQNVVYIQSKNMG